MNKELYAYVRQAMISGSTEEKIREILLGAGYGPKDINDTLILARTKIDYEKTTGGDNSTFKAWLRGYFRRSKKSIMTLISIDMVLIFLSLLEPWPIKLLADSVFGNTPAPWILEPYTGTFQLLLIVVGMSVAIFLFRSLVAVIDTYIARKLSYKLDLAIKTEMYNHIIRLPLFHKERLHKGDYIGRLKSLTGDVSGLVLDSSSAVVEAILTIVGVLAVLLFVNLELTLIGLVVVPLLYFSVRFFSPKVQKITEEIQGVIGRTNNHIQESIENTETIQSFTDEKRQVGLLQSLMANKLKLDIRSLFLNHSFRFTNSFLVILGSSAIMIIGGNKILNGALSLGELFIFINYMQRLYGPVEGLTNAISQIKKQTVGAQRVYQVINDHQEVEDPEQGYKIVSPKGHIRFEGVGLVYDDKTVLKDVNLDIAPGKKIGFIGPSGGGKSSLLKMVPKFIHPSSGKVFIDEYDISQSSLLSVRQNMSIISQTPQLFSGTILDNVLLGANNPAHVQNQDIENVLVASNSKEFIDKMQVGVNTYIGEAGSMLSGGQKQRISIARGLLKDAPIVIMDEPTSALDATSEDYIKFHLNEITAGKTVLMVTHKLSMLTAMDEVYVVDEGTVQNIENYGGLEVYLNYLNKHELG